MVLDFLGDGDLHGDSPIDSYNRFFIVTHSEAQEFFANKPPAKKRKDQKTSPSKTFELSSQAPKNSKTHQGVTPCGQHAEEQDLKGEERHRGNQRR
ncbi:MULTISPECIES: hypothetical protein [Halomonas]|jgi:hypothetical protein|uniref:hypothetical protein n=1 Tax=Halomonas TaxID=2745 RepID=UPI0011B2313D|nr:MULTISPECIES: hypothetical protein [Halomonas]